MMSHIEMEYAKTLKQVSQLERELAAAIASFNEERERAQREGEKVIELQVKLAEVNKALRIAVGLLSTYPKLSSEHPEYTLEYILNIAAMKEDAPNITYQTVLAMAAKIRKGEK